MYRFSGRSERAKQTRRWDYPSSEECGGLLRGQPGREIPHCDPPHGTGKLPGT